MANKVRTYTRPKIDLAYTQSQKWPFSYALGFQQIRRDSDYSRQGKFESASFSSVILNYAYNFKAFGVVIDI